MAAAPITARPAEVVTAARGRPATPGFVWSFRAVLYVALLAACLFGGPLTQALAIGAAVFALWGDHDGGIRHLSKLGGLAVAIWAAPQLGGPLGDWMAARFGWSAFNANAAGMVTAGIGVLLAIAVVARLLTRVARCNTGLYGVNRIFGGLLGAGEGALLVAALFWTFSLLEKPLTDLRTRAQDEFEPQYQWVLTQFDALQGALHRDQAAQWLTGVNPLPQVPAVTAATDAAELASDPEGLRRLINDPRMKELLELPVLRKYSEAFDRDPALRDAAARRDLGAIVRSKQFSEMLSDQELYAAISARWTDLRAALADAAAADPNRAPRPAEAP